MFGIHDYWLFVATGVLLNLTPGQDTFYILGRSAAEGTRSGVASALGIAVGSLVHTAMAALGLSAILATSASAFTVVKLLRSEEHTSELQSQSNLVCRLLLEKK